MSPLRLWLVCAECNLVADDDAARWRAYPTDLPAEVVIYCPECAEREFGDEQDWPPSPSPVRSPLR